MNSGCKTSFDGLNRISGTITKENSQHTASLLNLIQIRQFAAIVLIIFCLCYLFTGFSSARESVSNDTLKLAIFTPTAKVYLIPNGDSIGVIKRGEVIALLAADGKWMRFTSRQFEDGWVRWENTVTLQEWADQPSFDSLVTSIRIWEQGVKDMDKQIDNALDNILVIRKSITDGAINPEAGVALIEGERADIEESFRQLHGLNTPPSLEEAAELLQGKRWAINTGLGYLISFIEDGDETKGAAAGKYFELAENIMYRYSKAIFQVKTLYNLYDSEEEALNR